MSDSGSFSAPQPSEEDQGGLPGVLRNRGVLLAGGAVLIFILGTGAVVALGGDDPVDTDGALPADGQSEQSDSRDADAAALEAQCGDEHSLFLDSLATSADYLTDGSRVTTEEVVTLHEPTVSLYAEVLVDTGQDDLATRVQETLDTVAAAQRADYQGSQRYAGELLDFAVELARECLAAREAAA